MSSRLNPEAAPFIPASNMTAPRQPRVDFFKGTNAEYIRYLEDEVVGARSQLFELPGQRDSYDAVGSIPFSTFTKLGDNEFAIFDVRGRFVMGILTPGPETPKLYSGEGRARSDHPIGPFLYQSAFRNLPSGEDGDEWLVINNKVETVGVLRPAQVDQIVRDIDLVRRIDPSTGCIDPGFLYIERNEQRVRRAERRSRRDKSPASQGGDAETAFEYLLNAGSLIPDRRGYPEPIVPRDAWRWPLFAQDARNVGYLVNDGTVTTRLVDRVDPGRSGPLDSKGRFYLKWNDGHYPSVMHDELYVFDMKKRTDIGKLVKDEKHAQSPAVDKYPGWETQEQGPWKFVKRRKGEPSEYEAAIERLYDEGRSLLDILPTLPSLTEEHARPGRNPGKNAAVYHRAAPRSRPLARLYEIARVIPQQVRSALLRSRKIDIVDLDTGEVLVKAVPKQVLLSFVGTELIFPHLRNVGNNKQILAVPGLSVIKTGVGMMVDLMLNMCQSSDWRACYGLFPDSLGHAVEVMRAFQYFGFIGEADFVEKILTTKVLPTRALTTDDISCIWREHDEVGSFPRRYGKLRNSAYSDAIVYNLLSTRNNEVESFIKHPQFRDLKEQFDRQARSAKWVDESIEQFLKRCDEERRAAELAKHAATSPHVYVDGFDPSSPSSVRQFNMTQSLNPHYYGYRTPSPVTSRRDTDNLGDRFDCSVPFSPRSLSPASLDRTPRPSSPAPLGTVAYASWIRPLSPEGYRTAPPRGRHLHRSHVRPSRARSQPPRSPRSPEPPCIGIASSDSTRPRL